MPNPVAAAVVLTDDERDQLIGWSRRAKSANARDAVADRAGRC
jgi:hypothetical protein